MSDWVPYLEAIKGLDKAAHGPRHPRGRHDHGWRGWHAHYLARAGEAQWFLKAQEVRAASDRYERWMGTCYRLTGMREPWICPLTELGYERSWTAEVCDRRFVEAEFARLPEHARRDVYDVLDGGFRRRDLEDKRAEPEHRQLEWEAHCFLGRFRHYLGDFVWHEGDEGRCLAGPTSSAQPDLFG